MDDNLRAESLIGTLLKGKWKIEKIIGVGGTATVFLAVHRNQKRVAVKMLHYELSGYPDVRERFLREGYVANTLETDGVVEIIDDDVTDEGQAFLVMEVLDGETVEGRWERMNQKMPALEAMKWMERTLEVLHRAHQKGIIHRDIKPENLFITKEERLKVLDFGIARIFQSAEVKKATQQGYVMGTPAFMAPEQALGKWDEVDPRTDIWAVGASLFTLMTGRYVHNGRTGNEQLMKSATEQAPKLASVDPHVPRQLGELVDRALAFKRESRFGDAEIFRQAMLTCMTALGEKPIVPRSAPASSDSRASEAKIAPSAGKAPVEDDRPSGVLPTDEGTPEERLEIASMRRDRLLAEAGNIDEKLEVHREEHSALREKRKGLEQAQKASRGATPKGGPRALPDEIRQGREALSADVAHPSWGEVEQVGELWEAAERDWKALQAAQTAYDRAKFRLGWMLMGLGALVIVGLISALVAKPPPAPDTLELEGKH